MENPHKVKGVFLRRLYTVTYADNGTIAVNSERDYALTIGAHPPQRDLSAMSVPITAAGQTIYLLFIHHYNLHGILFF